MAEHESKTELFEDAKLIFRNFAGIEREFNSEGDRNFSIVVEPERAQRMLKEGWRIKQLKPRPGEEEGDYHLKVKVKYKEKDPDEKNPRDPKIVVITSKNRTEWGQREAGNLDVADIGKADVLVNGWWSDMAGGGYGGFLKTAFITLREDELELMYALKQAEESVEETFGEDVSDEELEGAVA
jgi:hypothetical protein